MTVDEWVLGVGWSATHGVFVGFDPWIKRNPRSSSSVHIKRGLLEGAAAQYWLEGGDNWDPRVGFVPSEADRFLPWAHNLWVRKTVSVIRHSAKVVDVDRINLRVDPFRSKRAYGVRPSDRLAVFDESGKNADSYLWRVQDINTVAVVLPSGRNRFHYLFTCEKDRAGQRATGDSVTEHKELDFIDDYRQTADQVSVPLRSGEVASLSAAIESEVAAAHLLLPDPKVLIQRIVTGLLAGHIVLAGPPGTGKTTLAKLVAEVFDCSYKIETATADWSTYDVIGGLQPKITGAGANVSETIAPWLGHVTEAVRQCAVAVARNLDNPADHPNQAHWLIIDEINRAEIDKAIGGLYTVLGGDRREPLRLWFEQDPRRQALWMPGRFRIIATMNSVDTSYVYSFSQGLTRRFKYVYVGVPAPKQLSTSSTRP